METFVKYYGGNLQNEGYRVISLDNGGYLLMGTMETSDRGKDICIIRTDNYGNSVAPVQLYDGGKNFDDIGYAIKKNSAGYIIAGSTATANNNDKKDILLIQFDENGAEKWRNTLGTAYNEEAFDFLVTSNNNIVLTGYTDSTSTLSKDMMVVRTDSTFKIIDKINHLSLQGDNVGYSITESGKEGEYVIAGYVTNWRDATENEIFVVKWTGLGIASPYFLNNYFSKSANAEAISILPAGNENYLLSCNFNDKDSSLIKVIKISFNGNFLDVTWNKNYGKKKINRVGCSRMLNDKIYILGTAGTNSKFDVGDILMLIIDSNGNNAQYNYVGDGSSYIGWGFDFTKDGYIIAGANKQNEFSLVTLIKVNNNFSL
jgi:hypothetical protein